MQQRLYNSQNLKSLLSGLSHKTTGNHSSRSVLKYVVSPGKLKKKKQQQLDKMIQFLGKNMWHYHFLKVLQVTFIKQWYLRNTDLNQIFSSY